MEREVEAPTNTWRSTAAYLTLPLWGTVGGLLIFRLFVKDTNGFMVLIASALPLFGAIPIYRSNQSVVAKALLTLLYFVLAGFVEVLVGWPTICQLYPGC